MTVTPIDGNAEHLSDEVLAKRAEVLASLSASGGGALEDHPVEDYFAPGSVYVVPLPNGRDSISHKSLSEGDLRNYRKNTNRDVTLKRTTGEASIKLASGEDRYELLKIAICDWNLHRGDTPYAYSPNNIETVLKVFPPHILDLVEADVRKQNPSLRTDATIEDLRKARADIDTEIEAKEKEEAGNANTSSS